MITRDHSGDISLAFGHYKITEDIIDYLDSDFREYEIPHLNSGFVPY